MIWPRDSRYAVPNIPTFRHPSEAPARRRQRRLDLEPLESRTLLSAGSLDTSYGGTGQVITELSQNTFPQGLAVQPDLKTVVVALEAPGGSPSSLTLIRYNVNGSLDSTFGSGGEVVLATNSIIEEYCQHNAAVAIQPDGKIVVAASTATWTGGSPSSGPMTSCDMLVLRFNTNGTLDTSFGNDGETDIHLAQGMAAANAVAVLILQR